PRVEIWRIAASSFSRPLARRESPMKPTLLLFLIAGSVLLGRAVHSSGQPPTPPPEAITGFDDQSNGFSDPDRRKADQKFFEEVESIVPDGRSEERRVGKERRTGWASA